MKRSAQDHRQKAEELLEASLIQTLPDPYDFHSVKVKSDFDGSDFTYSANIVFLLPDGMDKPYSFKLYGLNKSDMQLLAIQAVRKLLRDQLQTSYCGDCAEEVN